MPVLVDECLSYNLNTKFKFKLVWMGGGSSKMAHWGGCTFMFVEGKWLDLALSLFV